MLYVLDSGGQVDVITQIMELESTRVFLEPQEDAFMQERVLQSSSDREEEENLIHLAKEKGYESADESHSSLVQLKEKSSSSVSHSKWASTRPEKLNL